MSILKYSLFSLICLLSCSVVFAANEITVDSMTSVYDENSGVIVREENGEHSVIFNDKDQSVQYNVVLKNNTNKDIPIENLMLPKPSEDFLKYELTGLNSGDIIKANSTKDVVISLETVKTEGWGRNFDIELTAAVNLDSSVLNPNTNDFVVILFILSIVFGCSVFVLKNKKVARYGILIIGFFSVVPYINADKVYMVPIKINVSFESQNIMKANSCYLDEIYNLITGCGDYWNYSQQIKNIYIENVKREIKDYAYKFDVSEKQNGRVMAYLIDNEDYDNYYNLYLQADGIVYPNNDASYYFAMMNSLDSINNIVGLDTSNVTNMKGMFYYAGYNSTNFALDLSNFNTSNVTDMESMFYNTGYSSSIFTLDVSNFDTSSVTDMSYMFMNNGCSNSNFTLDVSNFDTSSVTDMSYMFMNTGSSNPNFTLDVSNFDTSKVTDMSYMFFYTGYNSTNLTLDLSSFDTSNVTNMNHMFSATGYSNPNFTLDVSNFDTSSVTDMGSMFVATGHSSPNFTLDVSNFDTSNVTNMGNMFNSTGYNSTNFTLDVSNFDTSNVTNMVAMFSNAGYNSTKFITSITIKNPKTTSYSTMFKDVATKNGSQITVNYTSETSELVDKMIATKSSNSNVVKGKLIVDVDNLSIGDEIHISGEKFNVISQTDTTITMLAQYNLGPNYRQNTKLNMVQFSNNSWWKGTPGPIDLDIQSITGELKNYVNNYVLYLQGETDDSKLTGTLITLSELKSLGCTINDDYSHSGNETCANSQYVSWLKNGQYWWTRSVESNSGVRPWVVGQNELIGTIEYYDTLGVRPVITISKEALKNYLKT